MVLWSRYANQVNQMGQRMGAWTAIGGSRWVCDGWNRIALLSPSNAVTEEYVWGLDLSGSQQFRVSGERWGPTLRWKRGNPPISVDVP